MRGLIFANMTLNTVFVLMAVSEMTGLTAVHQSLPWYFKWWWICALAGGNLFIHVLMLFSIHHSEKAFHQMLSKKIL